jgi:hypothetical protein
MRVCGRWLRPLTLAHLRLLEIIESPFLSGESVGIEDLAAAVAILAAPPGRARWMTGRRWALRIAAFAVVTRRQDWHVEAKALSEFLADNQWTPEMYHAENEPMCSVFEYSSSFSMRIAWMLCTKTGSGVPVKTHPVWSLSLMECLAWRLTDMELSGREYVTRDEAELTTKAVAAQVALEAAQNAEKGGA